MALSARRVAANAPSAIDLDAALAGIAAMNVDELRDLWREKRGQRPPPAFSRDLIARALAYWLQEEDLGGLDPRLCKLLGASTDGDRPPARHVKVGSIVVREYQGALHEALIVPGGFCWRGEVFASLSTIARKITGTSWNGPRFFGLRDRDEAPAAEGPLSAQAPADPKPAQRCGSIKVRAASRRRRGAA